MFVMNVSKLIKMDNQKEKREKLIGKQQLVGGKKKERKRKREK